MYDLLITIFTISGLILAIINYEYDQWKFDNDNSKDLDIIDAIMSKRFKR
jgi:hypothetical protein